MSLMINRVKVSSLEDTLNLIKMISNDEVVVDKIEGTSKVVEELNKKKKDDVYLTSIGQKLTAVLLTKHPDKGIRLLETLKILHPLIPELSACSTVKQDIRYHPDTVFEHCIKTCALIENTPTMRWAGLLHDIGKLQTQNRKEDGSVSFHKHELFSTTLAKKILFRLGISEEISREVCYLISMHMYHYSSEWTDRALARFIKKARIVNTGDIYRNPIFLLRRADRASRNLSPTTEKQADFEERIRHFILYNIPEEVIKNAVKDT